nr:hypothetical protein [Tanacetum cinerariifolium]
MYLLIAQEYESNLTQSALDALCEKFHIPDTVHPELPGPNDRIRNSPIVICYCGRQGFSFRDPVQRSWFVLTVDNFRRYYDLDENCYPTFWAGNDEEMDLFAFINHADPTKLRIKERKEGDHVIQDEGADFVRLEDEVPVVVAEKPKVQRKRKTAVGANGSSHPPKKLRDDHGTSGHVSIQEFFEQSTLNVEVSVTTAATVPVVTSSVTPTPERRNGGPTDLFSWPICRLNNHLRDLSSVPPPPLMTAAIATTVITGFIFALVSKVGVKLVSRSIFRDSTSPSTAEADVAGPSQPAERKKFKRRCVRLTGLLKDRDAENAALEGQVATLKSTTAIKDIELASSNAQIAKITQDLSNLQLSYDELSIKASSLESDKDKLIDQVSKPEGTCSELRDEVSEVNPQPRLKLVIKKCLQSLEYLDALGGAIGHAIDKGMQDGLAVGIDHEKAGQGLAEVVAYNPITEANYVAAVLQPRLQKANQLQPSPEQLMLPIHHPKDQVVIRETSLLLLAENLIGEASASGVLVLATTTTLSTTFVQDITVPLVSVADYEVLGSGPSIEVPSPSKIVFGKEELELENTMAS